MTDETINIEGAVCAPQLPHTEQIVMGHGAGGRMSHQLIQKMFMPAFQNSALQAGDDAALVMPEHGRLSISTDAHVVFPLFFPGGDIGRLAICGTVNDVAMLGAKPLYITAGFILEEGLSMDTLKRVIESMRAAAEEAGVQIVAGDTKVVQRGKADGLYVTTAGVGVVREGINISGANAKAGDAVILSGSIGDHGIAVLGARGELGFESAIQSDVAPLNHLIDAMLQVSNNIHVLRDPTRGGLATTLNEIAAQSKIGIILNEQAISVHPEVNAACEMLGFDPLYVANEGKLIAIVAKEDAEKVLAVMQQARYGEDSVIIGEVQENLKGRVLLKTAYGTTRVIDMLAGEMLPRIC
ncbi:hydrogenase expression/formation protein HypE [Candidatus Villigracilis saccharophilus]|uniref:hydrogenase expression/formation protein HypE n=1 Tax=Candidatus Villigracilis saccharophilus TaxID=3140684 RepID=UPI00313578B7|nr:hydrogenase expression/formation protein HypE [Anaerolineales bacterium]